MRLLFTSYELVEKNFDNLSKQIGFRYKPKLLVLLFLTYMSVFGQGPPVISYSPNTVGLTLNTAMAPLLIANTGSTIPSPVSNYGNVTTNPVTGIDDPVGLEMDAAGNLYVCDSQKHCVRRVNSSGVVTATYGLSGTSGFVDAVGTNARFNLPYGIAYDGSNYLYVTDRANNRVRRIDITNGAVTSVAGVSVAGSSDGVALNASFRAPTDIKYVSGSLYIVDSGNHSIRKFNLADNLVTTFAGVSMASPVSLVDGLSSVATFNCPTGLVYNPVDDAFYVVDRGNNRIRKIKNGVVSTFAGNATKATVNGIGTAASFSDPYAITIDGLGNLYVSQAVTGVYGYAILPNFGQSSSNEYIRMITPQGVVTTFAGNGGYSSTDNANKLLASFVLPTGLLFSSDKKTLYVSQWGIDRIREIQMTGYNISPSLPTGLTFNLLTGQISGTPTVVTAETSYTITGYNFYGSSSTAVSIATVTMPVFDTNLGSPIVVDKNTVMIASSLTSLGSATVERGFCWSTSPSPTPDDNKIIQSSTTGLISSTITGLLPNTQYYIRGYAKNSAGTVYQNATGYVFKTFDELPSLTYNQTALYLNSTSSITPQNSGGAVATDISVHNYFGNGYQANATTGFNDIASAYGTHFGNYATNSLGDLYFTYAKTQIVKKSASGLYTIHSGTPFYSGIRSTSTTLSAVRYNAIVGIAFDENNNMYVCSQRGSVTEGEHDIRKITPSGVVSFFASIPAPSSSTLGGMYFVRANDGNFYYTDAPSSSTVPGRGYKITSSGVVTTFSVGNNYLKTGLVVDSNSNRYLIQNGSLVKITPAGVTSSYCTLPSFSTCANMTIDKRTNEIYVMIFTGTTTPWTIKIIKVSGLNSYSTLFDFNCNNTTLQPDDDNGYFDVSNRLLYIGRQYNTCDLSPKRVSFYGYEISPSLPAGLAFNTSTGVISGTPTQVFTPTVYTVTAYNTGGYSETTFTLSVSEHVLTANSNQTFCPNAVISDIVIDNLLADSTVKYYQDSALTQELNASSALTSGTVYIKEILNGVTQSSTLVVNVSITSASEVSFESITESNLGLDKKKFSCPLNATVTEYVWSLPSEFVLESVNATGNEITVVIPSNLAIGDAVIKVVAKNTCGYDAFVGSRTLTPVTPAITTTDVIACSGASTVTYTVEPIAGSTYTWTLPTGMTLLSANNNVAQVSVGSSFASGNIQVSINSSNNTIVSRLAVTRVNAPVVITGERNICGITTATYSIAPVNGATSYVWSVPTGMSIVGSTNSTTINVSINSSQFSSGNVSVFAVTPCGNSVSRTLAVSKNIQPGVISGPKDICNNKTKEYTISISGVITSTVEEDYVIFASGRILGANNVQWDVPTGASIVSGQGSFIANISFDPAVFTGGTISLTNLSTCSGANPLRTQVVTSGSPSITGPTTLCGLTTAVYSVPNLGSNFVWTVPSWMTLTSGQGTNEIAVSFTELCNADVISLTFDSSCGSGSTAVTVTKTGIGCSNFSSLIPTLAGVTLTSFNQTLTAVGVLNPTSYRFVVNDGVSPERTFTSTTKTFNLANLTGTLSSNTTYSISVDVLVGGVWYIGGCTTNVITPVIPTSNVQSSQCNSVLASYVTPIVANAVSGATKYRFKVIDSNNVEYFHESNTNSFKLTDVSNLVLVNDSSYQVSVAASIGFDIFGSYDAACTITTPPALLTQLISAHCSSTLPALNTTITANNVSGATSYKFKVVGGSVNTEYISSIRQFKLTDIPNQTITFGTTYEVSVAVGQNGQYHSFGDVCTVTISLPKIQSSQCGATLSAINEAVRADFINGVTEYNFRVTLDNQSYYYFTKSVREFRLTDVQSSSNSGLLPLYFGATYHVSVAVKINNIWTDFGSSCSITTPPVITTSIITSQCGTTLNAIDSFITANNVTVASAYKFNVQGGGINEVFVSTSRQFKLTSLTQASMLRYATVYNISVAPMQDGVYHPYGNVCSITTPTKIQSSQCGVTLVNVNDPILADFVSGATQYRFKVIPDQQIPGYYQNAVTFDNTVRQFRLTDLSNFNLYYASTYQVSVAVKVNNVWSDYSTVCNVTTPTALHTTQIVSSQCGSTLASFDAPIIANSYPSATKYKFRISGGNLASGAFLEVENTLRQFKFNQLLNINDLSNYGQSFNLQVAAFVGGGWTQFSLPCIILTPSQVITQLQSSIYSTLIDNRKSVSFNERVYVDELNVPIEIYRFEITPYYTSSQTVSGEPIMIYETTNVFFRLSDLTGNIVNSFYKFYGVRVKVKHNGIWFDYGDTRFIKLDGAEGLYTGLLPCVQSSSEVSLDGKDSFINILPVDGALMYRFRIVRANSGLPVGQQTNYIYETSNPYFKLSDVLPSTEILYDGLYYILIDVKSIGGVWYNSQSQGNPFYGSGGCSNNVRIKSPILSLDLCDSNVTNMDQQINVVNATNISPAHYRYRISAYKRLTNETSGYFSLTSNNPYFKLSDFNGLTNSSGEVFNVNYNSEYHIIVDGFFDGAYTLPYPANSYSMSVGCFLTSPIIKVKNSQCGLTINLSDFIATNYATVANVSNYRFKIRPLADSNGQLFSPNNFGVEKIYDTNLRYFKLTHVPNLLIQDGLTYEVSISVKVNNVWSDYGDVCTLSLPLTLNTTSIVSNQCNGTLGVDDLINFQPVVGATKYRIKTHFVGNQFYNNASVEFETTNLNFRITDIYDFDSCELADYVSGKSWQFIISAYVNGSWKTYGPTCSINFDSIDISMPSISVIASQCNSQIDSFSTIIYADGIYANSFYTWSFSNAQLGISVDVNTTNNWITFNDVINANPGFVISPNMVFDVGIRSNTCDGYSPIGSLCSIVAPSFPVISVISSQCNSQVQDFSQQIFVDEVIGADTYHFDISDSNGNHYDYSVSHNWFSLSDFSDVYGSSIGYDSVWNVRVRASNSNIYLCDFGTVCLITAPSPPLTKIISTQCGAVLNSIYDYVSAEPISGALAYKFKIEGPNNFVTEFTSSQSGFYIIFDLPNIEFNTAYKVNVAVQYYNYQWGDYGQDCFIFSPQAPSLVSVQCNSSIPHTNTNIVAKDVSVSSFPTGWRFKFISNGVENIFFSSDKWLTPSEYTLNSNTTYEVSISVRLNGVWKDYGEVCYLTVGLDNIIKIDEDLAKDVTGSELSYSVIVYPNPFSETYSLTVNSESKSNITLNVFDVSGRLLENRELSYTDLSSYKFGDLYPSGVYTLTVKQDDNTDTIRVIKK
jgi:sugar lactone lactonase YvrE